MTIRRPQSIFEPLDKNIHNRADFDCGVHVLNHFLQTKARATPQYNIRIYNRRSKHLKTGSWLLHAIRKLIGSKLSAT